MDEDDGGEDPAAKRRRQDVESWAFQAETAAVFLPGPCSRKEAYAWPRDIVASCNEEEARRLHRHFSDGVVASSEYSGMLSEHEALGRPLEIFMRRGWHLPKHALRFDHACDIGPVLRVLSTCFRKFRIASDSLREANLLQDPPHTCPMFLKFRSCIS